MKAMKGLNVNRMLGSLKRKPREGEAEGVVDSGLDTPEANATRNVRLFCESGGPNGSGDEVLYLPTIVEACESSPSAAKEASQLIRKFLSKDHYSRPYVQYNSIMLIRILVDNPGKTFTRNFDAKFVQTVKDLFRHGKDQSVKQLLIETLMTFEAQKANDEGLAQLIEMWRKEHVEMMKFHGSVNPRSSNGPHFDSRSQNYFSRNHNSRHLPAAHELASRIEEAKTSAQLLSQTVQSTSPSELIQNELVREFADRCQSASRSVQAYMIAENPSPDNDTMETLIETNELLNKSMNQYQRATLNARKVMGIRGENTPPSSRTPEPGSQAPPGPPPNRTESGFAAPPAGPPSKSRDQQPRKKAAPPVPSTGDYAPTGVEEDPFRDPSSSSKAPNPPFPMDRQSQATGQFNNTTGAEPWHPGFNETMSYTGRQESSVDNVTMHTGGTTGTTQPHELESPAEQKPKKTLYRY